MAFVACDNEFSLFSPMLRCRTPYVAMILATVFLGSALIIGFERGEHTSASGENIGRHVSTAIDPLRAVASVRF